MNHKTQDGQVHHKGRGMEQLLELSYHTRVT
jgi:hypothetical protein